MVKKDDSASILAAAMALGLGAKKRVPRPQRVELATSSKKWSAAWWLASAKHEVENWRAQAAWWRDEAPKSLLGRDDSGLADSTLRCWLHAMRHGVPNAAELGRLFRTIQKFALAEKVLPLLDEAELAVDGLDLLLHVRDPEDWAERAAMRGIDLENDPACKALRSILRSGPKKLSDLEKDRRCPSRRKASGLLNAMKSVGMVAQTGTRGAWRFVRDTLA